MAKMNAWITWIKKGDPYENLANAIILQCAEDVMDGMAEAWRILEGNPYPDGRETYRLDEAFRNIEKDGRFFGSKECAALTTVRGKDLLSAVAESFAREHGRGALDAVREGYRRYLDRTEARRRAARPSGG